MRRPHPALRGLAPATPCKPLLHCATSPSRTGLVRGGRGSRGNDGTDRLDKPGDSARAHRADPHAMGRLDPAGTDPRGTHVRGPTPRAADRHRAPPRRAPRRARPHRKHGSRRVQRGRRLPAARISASDRPPRPMARTTRRASPSWSTRCTRPFAATTSMSPDGSSPGSFSPCPPAGCATPSPHTRHGASTSRRTAEDVAHADGPELSAATLLGAAVDAGVVAEHDARLIHDTRITGRPLREVARHVGLGYEAAKKRRQRAEAAWVAWWAPERCDPESR